MRYEEICWFTLKTVNRAFKVAPSDEVCRDR